MTFSSTRSPSTSSTAVPTPNRKGPNVYDASCNPNFRSVLDEPEVGISAYISNERSDGVYLGGKIKTLMEDFEVIELPLEEGLGESNLNDICDGEDLNVEEEVEEEDENLNKGEEEEEEPPKKKRRKAYSMKKKLTAAKNHHNNQNNNDTSNYYDEERTIFWFTMKKRGTDTLEAISQLASATGFPVKYFGFAGIKDAFAITQQTVSLSVPHEKEFCYQYGNGISNNDMKKIETIERIFREAKLLHDQHFNNKESSTDTESGKNKFSSGSNYDNPVEVLNFQYGTKPLYPGKLKGNRFNLVIRNCVNLTYANKILAEARDKGFINYIGLQRFGKNGARSDLIGLAYLKRDYAKCVEYLLEGGGSHGEVKIKKMAHDHHTNRWKEIFKQTGCAESALKHMPDQKLWAERRLMIAFSKVPKTLLSYKEACRYAFLSLPKSVRVLYVHAYLDRIWNLAASERILKYGFDKVVVGDVLEEIDTLKNNTKSYKVIKTEEEAKNHSVFDVVLPRLGQNNLEISSPYSEKYDEDEDEEHYEGAEETPSEETAADLDEDDESVPDEQGQQTNYNFLGGDAASSPSFDSVSSYKPHITTKEGQDVVTNPMPTHHVGSMMKSYLAYDGIEDLKVEMRIDPKLEEGQSEYGILHHWRVPGNYRKLIVKPGEMCWEVVNNKSSEDTTNSSSSSLTVKDSSETTGADNNTRKNNVTNSTEDHAEETKNIVGREGTLQSKDRKSLLRNEADSNMLARKNIKADDPYIKTSFWLGPGQYATMLMREVVCHRSPPPPTRVVFSDSDSE